MPKERTKTRYLTYLPEGFDLRDFKTSMIRSKAVLVPFLRSKMLGNSEALFGVIFT